MVKKVPMRKCIATGEQCAKKDLLRIVRTPQGQVEIDLGGKMNGRGAYLKKDVAAIQIAEKKKLLQRALEVEIDSSFFEKLKEVVNTQ